ncbi:hypothetical protein AB0465_14665 [Streptomyces griseoviridis]|uniref:hypothetical protein n=1 Tax=Streptomyces griseoviridis TaxID=45398 RepID=UPI00344DB178
MTKQSRVRINFGNKSGTGIEAKPASRVRMHLRDESVKEARPASSVRINLGRGKKH